MPGCSFFAGAASGPGTGFLSPYSGWPQEAGVHEAAARIAFPISTQLDQNRRSVGKRTNAVVAALYSGGAAADLGGQPFFNPAAPGKEVKA